MFKKNRSFFGGYSEIYSDLCRDNNDGCAGSRRALLGSGYLTILAQAITTGTFFTALLYAMGADDTYIGYVTMATTLVMAVQFLAPLFWERFKVRKALILWLSAFGDLLTYLGLPIVALLSIDLGWKLVLYMVFTLISGCISQFCLPAKNAWMMQSIPFSKRVSYSSLTSMVHTVINVISIFLAGLFMDGVEKYGNALNIESPTLFAVFVLRIAALILSIASYVWMAYRVKEFPYSMEDGQKIRLSVLMEPIRNRPFFLVILIPCLWALIAGMIGNYFNLHLIGNVKMSYTVISSASFISTPMILLITPIWTKILRQRDWIRTLAWAMLGYCLAYCCNVLISDTTPYFYFIAIIVGHLFSPCITMVSNNLIYVHMPEENRTAYFAFYSLLTTICSFIGQAIGTLFVSVSQGLRFEIFGITVVNLQFVSALAAILGVMLVGVILMTKIWTGVSTKGE